MKPYLGAKLLVNVDASHNGGNPLATGFVTALQPDGRVNVRVLYNRPARHVSAWHPEWLEDVTVYDTTDPATANRNGLYGAFWPSESCTEALLTTIIEKLEKIMTAQSDIDAATAALTALTGDVATNVSQLVNVDVPAINAAIAALQAQGVDTTALSAAVAAASGTAASLDSAVAGVTAIAPPPASAPAAPVSGGDGGTAS